jgi:pimeloyl-ACP methyl ester carboxylesterase
MSTTEQEHRLARSEEMRPSLLKIRDTSLFVEVVGHGKPLVLMHGGPGANLYTMFPFRRLKDQFTLVLYDHRCNGQSVGAPVSSMTWENLTADADALRRRLGFDRWAVLGHSFGGHVALEYALRYPSSLSHLVLLDTGADSRWARENAPRVALQRGFPPEKAELVRRWFHGESDPRKMFANLMSLGGLYSPHTSLWSLARELTGGEWRGLLHLSPDALIFAGRTLLKEWSILDRLGEIRVPTLVMAGRDDFIFPPEATQELAARIPGATLRIIEGAGHNPQSEQPGQVMEAIRQFFANLPTQQAVIS